MSNIVWRPQPKQKLFLERPEFEVLYGGAAGGGKSDAAVMIPLSQVHIPHFKALILRKTYPQLTELIDKSLNYYKSAFPDAKYNDSKHRWTFPSGATVAFGSMNHRKDRENYRGKQYDVIIFDELTHFTWDEYSFMFSRCRPSGPGTRCFIRSTTNPGGVGHGWVKDKFISCAPPMTRIVTRRTISGADGKPIVTERDRMFIPARVYDNQALLMNDPDYIANLAMLPEKERKAQLEGSWDSFEGQVFMEWRNNPVHYDDQIFTHVISPFDIPSWWRIYRGFDWGFSKPFAVGWFAVDEEERIYLFREYYGSNGVPDTGLCMQKEEVARNIHRIEQEDPRLRGKNIIGIADPAIFASDGGISIADTMEKQGVLFERGSHERIPGKMEFHRRLAFGTDGRPMFYCFNTCRNFIRTIPTLVYSESDVEDVDTKQEDHIYDMARYVFMSNPCPARKTVDPPAVSDDDPLDLREKPDRYSFYRI